LRDLEHPSPFLFIFDLVLTRKGKDTETPDLSYQVNRSSPEAEGRGKEKGGKGESVGTDRLWWTEEEQKGRPNFIHPKKRRGGKGGYDILDYLI